ncbi:SI1L3 protein, partial [Crypturellus undulatus]|nr:SI1L3 protein [Crypturellus undulatus]
FARGTDVPCVLGISNEFVVLLDVAAKEVVFNCLCGDVIGWTADGAALKVFYGRGDHVLIQAAEG